MHPHGCALSVSVMARVGALGDGTGDTWGTGTLESDAALKTAEVLYILRDAPTFKT